jgi:hypothetical protein
LLILTSNIDFFTSGVIPPVIAEPAAVSRNVDGIGCECDEGLQLRVTAYLFLDAHVYGALNIAYGMGTTSKSWHLPFTTPWLTDRHN